MELSDSPGDLTLLWSIALPTGGIEVDRLPYLYGTRPHFEGVPGPTHPLPESCLHDNDDPKRLSTCPQIPSCTGGKRRVHRVENRDVGTLSELPLSFLILIFKPSNRTIYPLSSVNSRL